MNRTVNGSKGGESVEKLITLGTPHHGSPMANGEARYGLDPIFGSLIVSFDNVFYAAIEKSSPEYYEYNRSDLRWDNFDNLFNYEKYIIERNDWLAGVTMNGDRTYDNKIIAYAGSFNLLDFGSTDLPTFAGYELGAELMPLMFLPYDEKTDGIVPYRSATFEGHTIKNKAFFIFRFTNLLIFNRFNPQLCSSD